MAKKEEDDATIREAKDRFKRCEDWEAIWRPRGKEDMQFANGDSDNMYQWDTQMALARGDKPCLTINKTRQHNLQIINDSKQNPPGISIKPVGNGATYEAAQIFEGIERHIEAQSSAQTVYNDAYTKCVWMGAGYFRIVTGYVSDESFDQDIFITRIKDPFSVYIDPDIVELDGSDAKFGFVFEDIPRERFDAENPKFKGEGGSQTLDNGQPSDWVGEDYVRVAEYFRQVQKADKLVRFTDPVTCQVDQTGAIDWDSGAVIGPKRLSELPPTLKDSYRLAKELKDPDLQERNVVNSRFEWFKIAGDEIIERRDWPGRFLPICRVIGEETVIDGEMDRKGHTRALKDPQRIYNYFSSESAAQVSAQTKTQWTGPKEAFDGYEDMYGAPEDYAFLPYNGMADGQPIAAPSRIEPPVISSGFVQAMQIAQQEMMMASGQYQSQFGEKENAVSGKAIGQRQRQGDTATYGFIDSLAIAVRYAGRVIVDLIPHIYDTERVVTILGEDGTESHVQVDPMARQAHQQATAQVDQEVAAIFNPNVGRYSVESDIGPAYATQRQEAFDAMTQVAARDPEFMHVAGDLLFKAADFPMANEIAERMARTIPPNILGDGPNPAVADLQQKVQQMSQIIAGMSKELKDKADEIDIRSYEAESKRLTALGNAGPIVTAEQVNGLVRQLVAEMLANPTPDSGTPLPVPQPPAPQPMGGMQ